MLDYFYSVNVINKASMFVVKYTWHTNVKTFVSIGGSQHRFLSCLSGNNNGENNLLT